MINTYLPASTIYTAPVGTRYNPHVLGLVPTAPWGYRGEAESVTMTLVGERFFFSVAPVVLLEQMGVAILILAGTRVFWVPLGVYYRQSLYVLRCDMVEARERYGMLYEVMP